jgi:metal-sulfur cluster biosynthetic enzyme
MDERKPESDSPIHSPDVTAEDATRVGDSAPVEGPSENQVTLALRKVKDPELGLNIIDLGLVYEILVEGKDVHINMTLTSPGCPAGPQIMTDVENAVKALPGVGEVTLNLVWTPYWTPERIEPRVRAYMGL